MTINRTMYVETDIYGSNTTVFFCDAEAAQEHAKAQLIKTIQAMLGADYTIPEKDIDADGYIDHFPSGRKPEISSSEWGWSIYDGISDSTRASIETVSIELTPAEEDLVFEARKTNDLRRDAKDMLYCKAGYFPTDGDSEDNRIAREWFSSTYGFSLEQAVDPESTFYIIDVAVELFDKYTSADRAAEDTWQCAIDDAILHILTKNKEKVSGWDIGDKVVIVGSDGGRLLQGVIDDIITDDGVIVYRVKDDKDGSYSCWTARSMVKPEEWKDSIQLLSTLTATRCKDGAIWVTSDLDQLGVEIRFKNLCEKTDKRQFLRAVAYFLGIEGDVHFPDPDEDTNSGSEVQKIDRSLLLSSITAKRCEDGSVRVTSNLDSNGMESHFAFSATTEEVDNHQFLCAIADFLGCVALVPRTADQPDVG